MDEHNLTYQQREALNRQAREYAAELGDFIEKGPPTAKKKERDSEMKAGDDRNTLRVSLSTDIAGMMCEGGLLEEVIANIIERIVNEEAGCDHEDVVFEARKLVAVWDLHETIWHAKREHYKRLLGKPEGGAE